MEERLVPVVNLIVKLDGRSFLMTTREARGLRDCLNRVMGPSGGIEDLNAGLLVNADVRRWPAGWSVTFGPLYQSAILVVDAQQNDKC